MTIPDYQSLMLPVLKIAGDGNEHRISDVVDALAKELGVTDAEREELLPSGKQSIFSNRVHWARTYLAQSKLLEPTRRGHFKITERGRSVLAENLSRIDAKFLKSTDHCAHDIRRTLARLRRPDIVRLSAVAESGRPGYARKTPVCCRVAGLGRAMYRPHGPHGRLFWRCLELSLAPP